MKSNKNMKSKPCLTEVTVTRTFAENMTSYRLFLMLDPTDHWTNTSIDNMHEVKFSSDEMINVQEIEVVTDRSGASSKPLFVLSKLLVVAADNKDHVNEVMSDFDKGEIEYMSLGEIVRLIEVTEV